jgi:hypothetical protein
LNLLVKGVPVGDVASLRETVCGIWCARTDAEPRAQFVGPVNDGAGLVRYISLHFLKPGQAPAKGWRGHRYSSTRDYLIRPASVMRAEARAALREKRRVWRALALLDPEGGNAPPAEVVEEVATNLREREEAACWRLVRNGGARPRRRAADAARCAPAAADD